MHGEARAIAKYKKWEEMLVKEGFVDEKFLELSKSMDLNDMYCQYKETLEGANYEDMKIKMEDLRDSSSSFGAPKVVARCDEFITTCNNNDFKGCERALEEVKNEFQALFNEVDIFISKVHMKGLTAKAKLDLIKKEKLDLIKKQSGQDGSEEEEDGSEEEEEEDSSLGQDG